MLARLSLERIKLCAITGSFKQRYGLWDISLRDDKIEIRINAESEIPIGQPSQRGSLERDRGNLTILEHAIQTKHLAQEQHAVSSQLPLNLDQCFSLIARHPVPINRTEILAQDRQQIVPARTRHHFVPIRSHADELANSIFI